MIGTDDKVSPDINLTKPPVSLKIDDLVAVTTWLYVHDGQRPPSPAKIVSAFRRFMTPQDWKAVTTIRPPKPPPGYFSLLATGEEPVEEIFRKAQCIVCHVIPGIPDATGSVGPALNMKSAALIRLNPHYSRALLLQSRIRRYDTLGRMFHSAQAGGLAARSVNILFKDALNLLPCSSPLFGRGVLFFVPALWHGGGMSASLPWLVRRHRCFREATVSAGTVSSRAGVKR